MGTPGHRCIALALAAVALGCGPPAAPPSFVLYVVDTLRRDALGVYGAQPPTPHVDALARSAVVFEHAYAPSSWTRASMASLFTGRPPTAHGAERRSDRLAAEPATLAEILRRAGYATAFVTANPNASGAFGFGRGFDSVIELFRAPGPDAVVSGADLVASSDAAVDRALDWLADVEPPFFLAVLDVGPHHPYRPPELAGQAERLARLTRELETEGATPELVARTGALAHDLYAAEVRATDRAFGRLVDALAARGLLERTLVVFTSDHGEEFLEHGRIGHGQSLHEEVLRVPLIVKPPEGVAVPGAAAAKDVPVSLVDLLPSALSMLGVDAPAAAGPGLGRRAPVTASLCLDGFHQLAIRRGAHKLLVDVAARRATLYDLARDPGESAPRRDAARFRALRRGLRRELGPGAFEARDCATASPELSEDVRRALDALGYAE